MRLWSEREHEQRLSVELPEVKRLDLSEVILTLKAAGIKDLASFKWLEAPDTQRLKDALRLLTDLGALDAHQAMTSLGKQMLAFPLHPRYARMLLAAQELGCVYQAALVAALTQGRDLLIRKVDRSTREHREELLGDQSVSDLFLLMRAWSYASQNKFQLNACKALGIHAQSARTVKPLLEHFLRIAKSEGLDIEPRVVEDAAIQKCMLLGFGSPCGSTGSRNLTLRAGAWTAWGLGEEKVSFMVPQCLSWRKFVKLANAVRSRPCFP